ncbi:MAG: hypothetical protein DRH70_01365 [Candidatus Coatesbacteria bacterium]|nr:MAG: hypothetical protein DRH70_01365 [Candidatus Coatesbacteria bacterium]
MTLASCLSTSVNQPERTPEAQRRYRKTKQAALKLLAARSLSIAELRRKLTSRGFDGDVTEAVIRELVAKRFLDDEGVSELYVQNLLERKAYGRRWFFRKLLQRGIHEETIRSVLDRIYEEIDEGQLAYAAAVRKLRGLRGGNPRSRLAKVARFLSSRGFAESLVMQVINERLSNELRAEDENGE